APCLLATSVEQAVEQANQIGYPIVLKIESQDIQHKTDVGGIELNLENEEEVAAAYNDILKNVKSHEPKADILGISVQKMAKSGTEVILGTTYDEIFGHMLMVGLGGIFVEIMKDFSLRKLPVSEPIINDMINELKGKDLLFG